MTSSDSILNQIDSALRDLTVSGDAMRSLPAAHTEAGEWERQGYAREGLAAWAEAVRPRLEEVGDSLKQLSETARQAAADRCSNQPTPRCDRPAWQSSYRPARRRR
jgi:hypothetical protein